MKFNRLMHTPVTDASTGKRVGRMTDMLLSSSGKNIIGIIVTNDMLFYSKRFYPWEDVLSVSVPGISVQGLGSRYFKPTAGEKCVSLKSDVYGKPVHRGMAELGVMRDAKLDLREARLLSLEVSRGLTEDLLHGRCYVSVDDGFKTDKAEVSVSPEETVMPGRQVSKRNRKDDSGGR